MSDDDAPPHERLLLAARFSQAAYGIRDDCSERQPGVDTARWTKLLEQPDDARRAQALAFVGPTGPPALSQKYLEDGTIGICDAILQIMATEAAATLISHFRNSMNGGASLWLLPARRTVVLAWKGSQQAQDWLQDGKICRHEWAPDRREEISPSGLSGLGARWSFGRMLNFRDVGVGGLPLPVPCFDDMEASHHMVHRGFLEQYEYDDLPAKVNQAVSTLLRAHEGFALLVTGHSLGGALAHLSAFELAGMHPAVECRLDTFGCPRVGNGFFVQALQALPNLRAYRVQNGLDPITRGPLVGYSHAGRHVWLKDGAAIVASAVGEGPDEATRAYVRLGLFGPSPSTSFDPFHHSLDDGSSGSSSGYVPHLLRCAQLSECRVEGP